MRSSLGGHYAGHGMAYDTDYNQDEKRDYVIPGHYKGCTLTTDNKEKDDFEKYCREQSGKVSTYSIEDLQKRA